MGLEYFNFHASFISDGIEAFNKLSKEQQESQFVHLAAMFCILNDFQAGIMDAVSVHCLKQLGEAHAKNVKESVEILTKIQTEQARKRGGENN